MCVAEKYFPNFSTKIYVVGTQKNCLNETVLLSTQIMFRLLDEKIIAFLRSKIWLTGPMSGMHDCVCEMLTGSGTYIVDASLVNQALYCSSIGCSIRNKIYPQIKGNWART